MSLGLMRDCWLHFENATSLWLLDAYFLTPVVLLWTLTVHLLCRMVRRLITILIFIMTTPKWLWIFRSTTGSRMENCTSGACTRMLSQSHIVRRQNTLRVSTNSAVDCYIVVSRCMGHFHCRLEYDTTLSSGWGVQWQEINCAQCVIGFQT